MNHITVIGMDISKHVFHIVGLDTRRHVAIKRHLKRPQVLAWFANQAACQISMEACASSHYWGRELTKLGHTVKLLPAQQVKAFVQGNKNDYNDALAIAEATNRPNLYAVPLKTTQQQDLQAIQRMRKRAVTSRTALCNQTRGLLGEYGIIIPKGVSVLRKVIPTLLEEAANGLSPLFRTLLSRRYDQLIQLDTDLEFYTTQLTEQAAQSLAIQRLQTIPGFGPIVASAYHIHVGNGRVFANGRAVSASLGLVPRQHSTGGKPVLSGISKRGDQELRSLLVHGARSVVRMANKREDRLSRWVCQLVEKRGMNKATVALANKLARIAWAVTTKQTDYSRQAA
jgi:transposase